MGLAVVNFGYIECNPGDPLESKQLARVSALLDEAVEELENAPLRQFESMADAIAISKVREAQGILLGERPVHPEEN